MAYYQQDSVATRLAMDGKKLMRDRVELPAAKLATVSWDAMKRDLAAYARGAWDQHGASGSVYNAEAARRRIQARADSELRTYKGHVVHVVDQAMKQAYRHQLLIDHWILDQVTPPNHRIRLKRNPNAYHVHTRPMRRIGLKPGRKAREAVREYDPDQPRDEYGRWTDMEGYVHTDLGPSAEKWHKQGEKDAEWAKLKGLPEGDESAFAQAQWDYGINPALADLPAGTNHTAWARGYKGKGLELMDGYRYGPPPETGQSYNHADQRRERGTSVFSRDQIRSKLVRNMYGNIAHRGIYHVHGYYAGKGADGEDLLIPVKYKRVRKVESNRFLEVFYEEPPTETPASDGSPTYATRLEGWLKAWSASAFGGFALAAASGSDAAGAEAVIDQAKAAGQDVDTVMNRLIKTQVQVSIADADDDFLKDYGDLLEKRIWTTMDDERVCYICRGQEGLTQDEASYDIPAHPLCRCWWRSLPRDFADLAGELKVPGISPRAMAFRDPETGETSGVIIVSFDGWAKQLTD